jgi:hypothetical protein
MRKLAGLALLALATPSFAGELCGPGRFCGYAPIVDLLDGESITTLEGGIHGGTFRWDGPFGNLHVWGIGWAGKPVGRVAIESNAKGLARFKMRREKGKYVVAIWNRKHGAAYFKSDHPLTRDQVAAIDRVDLFEEGGLQPEGCRLRTIFVWE